MIKKTALILGASGLVGSHLVHELTRNKDFEKIILFGRKHISVIHPKVEQHIVDLENISSFSEMIKGDVLFSCLGTTLKTAGSKENQYKVDFTYQYEVAKAARDNNVNQYILVSSVGASARAWTFYLKMKGELDDAIQKLKFHSTDILRPNLLRGIRKEVRKGERLSEKFILGLNKLGLLKSQTPIHARDVAKKMIKCAFDEKSHFFTWCGPKLERKTSK